MRAILRPLGLLLAILWISGAAAEAQTIEQIVANPSGYAGSTVEISGLVTRYSPAARPSTGVYLIASDYGAVLRVNTSAGAPELNRRYRVSGTIQLDPVRKTPSLTEVKRLRLNAQGAPDEPQAAAPEEESGLPIWVIVVGPLAVAAGAVGFLLGRRKKKPATTGEPSEPPMEAGTVTPEPIDPPTGGLKTIRLTPANPTGTLYLPGELVLVSGEDKGKSFRISGFPTPQGIIVTIGREPVKGERAYAHVQIDEKFHTVSRKQAELIWNEEKLLVRNLSETNPTQVNGVKLEKGKTAILTPGARMRTGELEFEYRA